MSTIGDKIAAFLKTNPNSTLNFICQKGLGISKPNQKIIEEIRNLTDCNIVVSNNSGRYITYSLVNKVNTNAKYSVSRDKGTVGTPVLPIDQNLMKYFNVSKTKSGFKIKHNSTNSVFSISSKEYLLVINDRPLYTVETANDVLACIRDYTTGQGMTNFVVTDMATNKMISAADIKLGNNKILAIKIQKHNKAG